MDAAVFRPSTGEWFVAGTKDGFAIYNFGVATDKPVSLTMMVTARPMSRYSATAVESERGSSGSTGNYRVINFGND